MSTDELMVWLISAMSLTAVVLLLWTLGAVVRTSRWGLEKPRLPPLAERRSPGALTTKSIDFQSPAS